MTLFVLAFATALTIWLHERRHPTVASDPNALGILSALAAAAAAVGSALGAVGSAAGGAAGAVGGALGSAAGAAGSALGGAAGSVGSALGGAGSALGGLLGGGAGGAAGGAGGAAGGAAGAAGGAAGGVGGGLAGMSAAVPGGAAGSVGGMTAAIPTAIPGSAAGGALAGVPAAAPSGATSGLAQILQSPYGKLGVQFAKGALKGGGGDGDEKEDTSPFAGLGMGAQAQQLPSFADYLAQFGPPVYRQAGGPVAAGQPAVVGEAGPEVVVPRQPVNVVPTQGGNDGSAADTMKFVGSRLLQGIVGGLVGVQGLQRISQAHHAHETEKQNFMGILAKNPHMATLPFIRKQAKKYGIDDESLQMWSAMPSGGAEILDRLLQPAEGAAPGAAAPGLTEAPVGAAVPSPAPRQPQTKLEQLQQKLPPGVSYRPKGTGLTVSAVPAAERKAQAEGQYWQAHAQEVANLRQNYGMDELTAERVAHANVTKMFEARGERQFVPKEAAKVAEAPLSRRLKEEETTALARAKARIQRESKTQLINPATGQPAAPTGAAPAGVPGGPTVPVPQGAAPVGPSIDQPSSLLPLLPPMPAAEYDALQKELVKPMPPTAQRAVTGITRAQAGTTNLLQALRDPELGPQIQAQRGPLSGRLASQMRQWGFPVKPGLTLFDTLRSQLLVSAQAAEAGGSNVRAFAFLKEIEDFLPKGGEAPGVLQAELSLLADQLAFMKSEVQFRSLPRPLMEAAVANGLEPKQPPMNLAHYYGAMSAHPQDPMKTAPAAPKTADELAESLGIK